MARICKNPLLWIDLETTGTEDTALVLEVGGFISNYDLSGVRCHFNYLIDVPLQDALDSMTPFVVQMHTESGLLEDLKNFGGVDLPMADQHIASVCAVEDSRQFIVAGNSVHQDLIWIRKKFPALRGVLNHRIFDVSTLRRGFQIRGYIVNADETKHRALEDAEEAYRQAELLLGSFV